MKKILLILLAMILMGCQSTSNGESEAVTKKTTIDTQTYNGKILIAYFSRVGNTDFPENTDASSSASVIVEDQQLIGNTEYMADVIVEQTGGDKFLIQTETPYPADYDTLVDQQQGERDQNSRPVLSSHVENFNEYDVIYLGFPNWWYGMPMPLYSFLEEYDFSDKTIIPFNTSGGSGFSDAVEEIKELCPQAKVLEGLTIHGDQVQDAKDEIVSWIDSIND
ncbi:flavodoxin [Clostridium sp. AUH-JLR23]|uniref:flavodoxin n=1 Tax=Clostridium sp. AUH-JLR23 TaxID=1505062 RepID=UPI00356A7C3D